MSLLTPERRVSGTILQQRRYSRVLDAPVVHHTTRGPTVRVDDDVTSTAGYVSQQGGPQARILSPEALRLGNLVAQAAVVVLVLAGVLFNLIGYSGLLSLFHLLGFVLTYTGMFFTCCGLFVWWRTKNQANCDLGIKRTLVLYGLCSSLDLVALLFARHPGFLAIQVLPSQVTYFLLLGTSLLLAVALVAHKDGLGAVLAREAFVFVGLVLVLHFSTGCLFDRVLPSVILPQLVYVSALAGLTLCEASKQFEFLPFGRIVQQLQQPTRDRVSVSSASFKYLGTPGRKISVASGPTDGESSSQSLRPGRHSFSSTGSMLQDVEITEASGLIGDLLLNEHLSEGVEQKLKKVCELLAPRVAGHTAYTPRMNVANPIAEDRHDHESDVVTETNPQGPRVHQVARRSGNSGVRRTSHFSTTTTSSGMPVLLAEPSDRYRSLAVRDVRARVSVQESSIHRVQRGGREHDAPRSPSSATATMNFFALGTKMAASDAEPNHPAAAREVENDQKPSVADKEATPTREEAQSGAVLQPSKMVRSVTPLSPLAVASHSTRELSPPTATVDKGGVAKEEVDGVTTVADDRPRALRSTSMAVPEKALNIPESIEERSEATTPRLRSYTLPRNMRLNPFSGELESVDRNKNLGAPSSNQTPAPPVEVTQTVKTYQSLIIFSKYTPQDYNYPIEEYSSSDIKVLEEVSNWDFPIFELKEKAGNHILSQMAYCLFNEAGLMETFKIQQRKFINYFRALEAHYGNNVYHNKVHAADVLHATSFLLFEIIPEFSCTVTDPSERVWTGNQRTRLGNIASAFSILEVFATYMAAAVHDFDHPGRTNAFLVATRSPLAILYNDRAVLENHHSAASWDLLISVPEHNFLDDMEEAELKRFRFLLVEAVLATDLKMHFDLLSDFRAKVDPEEGGGIDWSSEVDRLMVIKMIMKMADISTPTKSYELHRAWTKLITEEFYQQGEQEVALGLPPTIFLDRKHPEKLPAVQLSFIQNLVSPLFHVCAQAGVIPGVLDDEETPLRPPSAEVTKTEGVATPTVTSEESRSGDVSSNPGASEDEDSISVVVPAQKFVSIILSNMQLNYEAWQAELPPQEAPLPPSDSSKLEVSAVVVPAEGSSDGGNKMDCESGGNVPSVVESPALQPVASVV